MTTLRRRPASLALAAGALLVLTTAGCGGSDEGGSSGGRSSPESSESSAPEPPEDAAGECSGETQELEGADGVRLTVPAAWSVESLGEGEDTRFVAADGDSVEGQLVVQANGQTVDEGVSDAERLNSQSEKTGDEEIELPGFDAARQLTFEGANTGATNTTVVAVSGELRVIAYAIVEDSPDDLALATGCMLTLQR